jgi:hypothetical protein
MTSVIGNRYALSRFESMKVYKVINNLRLLHVHRCASALWDRNKNSELRSFGSYISVRHTFPREEIQN